MMKYKLTRKYNFKKSYKYQLKKKKIFFFKVLDRQQIQQFKRKKNGINKIKDSTKIYQQKTIYQLRKCIFLYLFSCQYLKLIIIFFKFADSYLSYHEILDLDFSEKLYEEHALIIGNTIKKCQNLKNLTLNLSKNQLDFQCLQLIIKGVHECQNLQVLYLNLRNVCLTDKGEYLGMMIVKNINIQKLTLILNNNCIHNQDVYNLVLGVSKCPQISSLGLHFNDIDDQGISLIGQSLAQFRNLKSLKLVIWQKNNYFLLFFFEFFRFNNNGVACLQDLQMGIAQCENLSILNLIFGFQNNQIKQQSLNTLAHQIKFWKKITSLRIILEINKFMFGEMGHIIDLQAKKLERLVDLRIINL
ncbi:transmembrane protein, putative (macronuclear) [Tetrahymena thermophila SB210]|uniref:Transmembrane protein, putative n=1 Tax=Tetrahymena thermophila (strain SB210) TaxID=312017 RepID=I7LZQ2_TETTS|nr:transmembrane protein, putative [Tetrahymena thermophila SB210]EAR84603.2 transmembrane protein, putative [Tetrahymena thermophila SB210]|eukprot:XP_001032266.2 transmembrane protein, putative [Tetrahymena thermophila SB210]